MISVVVPIYKNSENIVSLLRALRELNETLRGEFEAVLVVDGSPDDSFLQLRRALPLETFHWQLLGLSRNFGSFAAIRAGLKAARGDRFAVMAADLQEPPDLIVQFDQVLRGGSADIAIGVRTARSDPWSTRLLSSVFWGFYRWAIQPEIPPGGVDIFGCSAAVRTEMLALHESNSSLIGLLFWVGFQRALIPYARRQRELGVSAWTFKKKLRYLMDSVYSFSDLPIRLLTRIGAVGLVTSFLLSLVVAVAKLSGTIPVPGYAATVLTVTFFGALNCFGLGIIGNYVWRGFENTKNRPGYVVSARHAYPALSQLGKDEEHG